MTALRPIAIGSLADEAQATIVQAITNGEFKPGERLSEVELARRLGISRGPLREALGRLEGRLVTRTPRIGFSVITLTRRDLDELLALREALEGMTARLAATRITAAQLRGLEGLMARHDAAPSTHAEDRYIARPLDDEFHERIARASGNARIEAILFQSLYFQLQLYRFRGSARPGGAATALAEHRRILEALAARDPDAAEAAMRDHLRRAAPCYVAADEAVPPNLSANPQKEHAP